MKTVHALCIAAMVLTASEAKAEQAPNSGASLYEDCKIVASARQDLSDLRPADQTPLGFCVGYLTAAHTALVQIHSYHKTMPNYGNWQNERFVKGWVASQLLLAPDICFPKNINVKTLAMILVKYGRQHPENLTSDMFKFVGYAFSDAYPAGRGCEDDE